MEEICALCNMEICYSQGIHSLQILAQTANSEPLLSSNTKPGGWMLAILSQKKKTKSVEKKELQSAQLTDSEVTGVLPTAQYLH